MVKTASVLSGTVQDSSVELIKAKSVLAVPLIGSLVVTASVTCFVAGGDLCYSHTV